MHILENKITTYIETLIRLYILFQNQTLQLHEFFDQLFKDFHFYEWYKTDTEILERAFFVYGSLSDERTTSNVWNEPFESNRSNVLIAEYKTTSSVAEFMQFEGWR